MPVIHIETDGRTWMKYSGHANYAPAGSDIVCAGVSALINAMEYQVSARYGIESEGNIVDLRKIRQWERFQAIPEIEMALAGLKQIAEQYPEYIEIKETE